MRKPPSAYGVQPTAAVIPPVVVPPGNLSIEEMSIEQIMVGRTVLSVEEEMIALQEADTLQAEVMDGLAEAYRVEDFSDAMLNMADVVENIPSLTPQQARLIDTASELAVAGTTADPTSVIPSVESFVGKSLAVEKFNGHEKHLSIESFVEGIRKRAAELWARIRAFVISMWEKLTAFLKRIFDVAPRHLNRIKELREQITLKVKEGDKKPKAETVQIMVGTTALSYPSYMVRNASELNRGLDELKKLGDWVYGQYLKTVKIQGDLVASELKKFDPHKASESLNAVARGMVKINFNNVIKSPAAGYMGCFDLRVSRIEKNAVEGQSDAQIVNALRHTKVTIEYRDGQQSPVHREGFATMTFVEMNAVLTTLENLLKQIIAFETSSDYKALEKTRQDMIEGGNASTAAMAKIDGNDDTGKMQRAFALDVMKGLQNFNTTFVGWSSNLTFPMAKKVVNASRASLVLVEKSLAQY